MENTETIYAENAAMKRENLRLHWDNERLARMFGDADFERKVWRAGFWILCALLCLSYVLTPGAR